MPFYMKKILFICGNIHPNSSQGVRYKNLIPFWSKENEVTLLSYRQIKIDEIQQQVNLCTATQKRSLRQDSLFKTWLLNIYKRFFRQFIFPDRYKYALSGYKYHMKTIFATQKIDTVIIGMTPYSLYPLARFIKKIDPAIRVFVDLSDPFFGNAGNKGKILFNKTMVKRYESRYLKYCDGIVVLNPQIERLYKQVYSMKNRVHVIEQGFPDLDINKLNITKNTNKQRLIYAGGLNKWYRNPFPLYHAINQINESWHLDLYGNISEELLPTGKSNVHYHGLIDYNSLIKEYAQADVLVFIDNAYGYQVPGKLLEVISIGKPVLFIYNNPKSPSFYYIADAPHVFKVQNLAEKITEELNIISETAVNFEGMSNYKQYEWKNLAKKYLNIINV